jgi:hypothetical protein
MMTSFADREPALDITGKVQISPSATLANGSLLPLLPATL